MKKVIFGMFLLVGTTFGFANNTTPTANKTSVENLSVGEKLSIDGKTFTIDSITYDENGKCTLTTKFVSSTGSTGTITVTADTCAKAAKLLATMFEVAGA